MGSRFFSVDDDALAIAKPLTWKTQPSEQGSPGEKERPLSSGPSSSTKFLIMIEVLLNI